LIEAACERAKTAARTKHAELEAADTAPPAPAAALTLGMTYALLFHEERGRYSEQTGHGRDVARALAMAVEHWGEARAWASITRADWRSLWRYRLDQLRAEGHGGYRGAELVVQCVATVASWLVEEDHVPAIKQPEREWRQRLVEDYRLRAGTDPVPSRPRHTLEEMRRLLEAAEASDPRFALLLTLGAELRLGQVARCRRRDLDLAAGTLTVRGRGKKGGTIIQLTAGQRAAAQAALVGYLRALEEMSLAPGTLLPDYPLFPQGQLPGNRKGQPRTVPERHGFARSIGRRWILAQFALAEAKANIPHVPGRGAYGLRRVAVDAVLELRISREALRAHGGWSDTQVPDRIYATQEQTFAQAEAARLRAQYRGEA